MSMAASLAMSTWKRAFRAPGIAVMLTVAAGAHGDAARATGGAGMVMLSGAGGFRA